jgi:two-component system chemotaxis sensor kinase CheA
MKIEDEELRALFQAESEEHLQRMEEGLLRLEQEPHNQSMLEEVYREAHSLKGAARMIGVRDVETVAHRFEDLLGPAKRGQATLTSDLIDRLSQVLDGIRRLVDHAITGTPSGVDVVSLLDALNEPSSDLPIEKSKVTTPCISEPKEAKFVGWAPPTIHLVSPTTALPGKQEKVPGQASSPQSETIRVDSKRLDTLMTHAGELTVTKSRLKHRVQEIEQLRLLRESWMRDLSQHRVGNIKVAASMNNGVEGQLQQFYHEQQSRLEEFGELVEHLAKTANDDQQRLEALAYQIDEGVRNARLLPFSVLFERYRRTVRDISRELGKAVDLVIEGGDTRADKHVLDELKAPLMHVVRNAVDHGIEAQDDRARKGKPRTGTVRLSASQRANTIVVTVTDDGRGLDLNAIKQTALRQKFCRKEELDTLTPADLHAFVLASGFSTRKAVSDISGRGIGMDVVRATVERLKGTIRLDSTPGNGCEIHIELPVTLSTMRVLTIFVNQYPYAVPIEFVEGVRLVQPSQLFPFQGHRAMSVDGETVSVIPLSDLLQIQKGPMDSQQDGDGSLKGERVAEKDEFVACLMLKVGTLRLGCLVDTLGDEQEVVLKPYSTLLKRVRNVSGCTILGTGEICTILNPSDLLRSAHQLFARVPTPAVASSTKKPTILFVEDSLTIRAQIKGRLQEAGYEVVTAVDGIDGLNRLHSQPFDAVISDVQMPRMDGFALTAAIRKDPSYTNLPIVLFTSLSEEADQLRGQEAGATAYVIKTESADVLLLEALRKLI